MPMETAGSGADSERSAHTRSTLTRSTLTRSTLTRSTLTRSAAETRALGADLALMLKAGDVVALRGDLGAGKTCLIQGICQGLQVDDIVNSPTFILVNEYAGRIGTRAVAVYHFDLYRLTHPAELIDLGVEDYFSAGAVCLFEWAERGGEVLPLPRWEVELEYVGEEERRIAWQRTGAGAGDEIAPPPTEAARAACTSAARKSASTQRRRA